MRSLIFIAALLLAGPQTGGFGMGGNPRPDNNYAFFEFAPANGKGMGNVCGGTTPTGARGETLTFTRATTATCTKTSTGGLATTGIANGDLVSVSSGQPRVEYDANGVKGLLVEEARTNIILRSQEIENASWTKGASVGTITADYATAPDGTMTADRYQYSNTTNDYILQTFSVGGLAATGSVYLKGTSGSGTINLCRGGATSQCVTCSYVSTSWSRCVYAGTLAASNNLFIGCDTPTLGAACAQTGLDVLVWGLQGELGAYVTSYIPTTNAAVARNAEVPTVNGAAFPTASYSIAASVIMLGAGSGNRGFLEGQVGSNSGVGFFTVAGFLRAQNLTAGADNTTNYTWASSALTQYRVVSLNDGSNQTLMIDGAVVAGPSAATHPDAPWSATTGIGYAPAFPAQLNGIISRVCLDPSPTRCR